MSLECLNLVESQMIKLNIPSNPFEGKKHVLETKMLKKKKKEEEEEEAVRGHYLWKHKDGFWLSLDKHMCENNKISLASS